MAAMTSLLKASSSYYTNLSINRRIVTTPATRISLPINGRIINFPTTATTQISLLPKITTATTSCSSRGSSTVRVQCVMNNSKTNCFKKKKEQVVEEKLTFENILNGLARIVVVVVFVWGVIVKKNPPSAIFLGLWLSYDVCKTIHEIWVQYYSRTRNDDEPIFFRLGPVLYWIFPLIFRMAGLFGVSLSYATQEEISKGSVGDDLKFQKLTDDVDKLSSKIKVHEENLRIIKSQSDKLDESILYMRGILQIKGLLDKIPLGSASTEDVLGILAFLGTVDDDNLSRIFSEYLGLETMLAIICKTGKSLETCSKGPSNGRPIDGRFLVICLEDLRPYAGDFVAEDPQRRLAIPKPRLPNGECPPGFLGFAVNMINLDKLSLNYVTSNGNGLRETLFYSLFSHLQVYRTKAEMQLALPCISDGAVSLDGGMIRSAGVFSLGTRKDVEVRFMSGTSNPPVYHNNAKEKVKIMKSDKKRLLEDMQREQALLNHAKHSAESKRQELSKFLAELAHESATSSGTS